MSLYTQSMGKSKTIGYKHVNKNLFRRLYSAWCENGGDEKIKESKDEKEEVYAIKEQPTVSELHLMKIEESIDLHGATGDEAYFEAISFLKEQYESGKRKVEIVVGKGLHSKDGKAVVKENVKRAIATLNFIREYYSPSERYGGGGTFHIIFKAE